MNVKSVTLIILCVELAGIKTFSQTLQTVTDNGNSTSRNITIGTGYSDAKLNVNAIGVDANNSQDVTFLLTNHRYNSVSGVGENRIVFGWANHWAASISAYKETANTTGFKFYTEIDYNTPVERMRINKIK